MNTQITPDDIDAAIACEIYVGGINLADSMRFLWLTEDLESPDERAARGQLVDRIPGMSTSAVRQDIDAIASIGPAIQSIGSAFDSVTLCLMVLQNGTKIVGVNYGPVDPANYDADKGRQYAREDAVRQIWPLLGFELRNKLVAAA
jgi:Phage protein (N4 Gp49/phage Sf6 gene 66) family